MVAQQRGMHSIKTSLLSAVLAAATGASAFLAAPVASADIIDTGFHLMAPVLEGQLNMNTATEKQWELLPGIGPATAKKLVAYRNRQPFKEPMNLMRIKGIGRKTFNACKPFLTVKGETTLHVVGKTKSSAK